METLFEIQLIKLIMLAFCGMFLHFLKKKVRGESLTAISRYFTTHPKYTLMSSMATMLFTYGYFHEYMQGGTFDIIAAVMIGYNCDSLFNKLEETK